MANPQAENGHTDIANEILGALWKINLSSYEWRVLLYLFRKTYGWHKKMDRIALSQFSKDIGINRVHVHRALKKLSLRNIIVTYPGNSQILSYGFQKNYEKWKLLPNQVTVTYPGNKTVTYPGTHKRNSKETILRDSQKPNPAVKEFLGTWGQLFKERTGREYFYNGGKEGSLCKKMLKAYPPDRLKELAGVFFKSQTKFFQDSGYTIGFFYSQINKVVIEAEQRKKSW